MSKKFKIGLDLSRRDFIKMGSLSVASLALNRIFTPHLKAEDVEKVSKKSGVKAKAVIQIFLAGGPCHLDTFDPKPHLSTEYTGSIKGLCHTNIDGIDISTSMPLTARHADKYSIIRGMTHGDNSHEVSTYMMLSGLPSGLELVYPSIGAVMAYDKLKKGETADVPPFISVMNPYSRFDESGFIGESGRSFAASGIISNDDLKIKTPEELKKSASKRKLSADFSDRRSLLEALDTLSSSISEEMKDVDSQRQLAYSMLSGKGREAFDLTKESVKMREIYGDVHHYGQQLLLARRLVEAGATFVNVMLTGWDTHKKHFEAMSELLPALDKAYSALLEDLNQRGLLETTIVTLGGEFGRTPKVLYNTPWMGGRNHFGSAFSWLVAGGGFRGANVVGKTDDKGEKVIERPVYPWDLSQSIYELAGIDTSSNLPHPTGCVAYVIPPEVKRGQSGGILKEIMYS